MRKKIVGALLACAAVLVFVAPAASFSVVNPSTGECRQVLVPGPDTFPGNWEVVSATPADGPARGTATATRTTTLRSGR